MSFSDKVVIVTGAGAGIGAAIAELFNREGANVAMVDRNETALNNIAQKCENNGKKPLRIKADVSIEDEAKSIINETVDVFGTVDVLVNNAGFVKYGNILDGTILEAYDEVMATNLRAIVHLTALVAPYLKETKGNIVNISSVAAESISDKDYLSYSISKAGLSHFTRGAALELAAFGVRVNSVSPGPVRTDIVKKLGFEGAWKFYEEKTALKKLVEPEEIADLVLYLASDKAASVTGSMYVMDNGYLLKH